ncbi:MULTISPECIES: bifunctional serine/threonine protein kinase/MFS transporter [Adlercreutzia]|uniref:Protein kinase n=1 Tax=Adlercreutzia rubneri TaxID=2916441 RepID=A0A7K1T7J3_9ACTN|nr:MULTISPECIES: bifunctional serine/threonine protein kinase/MFS transporter [Adlercreutzia]MEE0346395.1 protein kinase [Adlercreutzia sp.]MEE0635899.1 protein kinase [Adlercreutzia sp.]MVN59572.1 protein kinase [Adlercreutzia rubneri]RDC44280.1 serine/threonine protein kinase [Adlercreutzia equolifaciens subsp. celatus]
MARSPLILDRYRVIDQAGSGGYGTVVHAFDTHLKRDVAIKCIELSEDELAAARLEALEARMAADLEEVEAGASGAETGVAGRNAGPGAVSAAGAGMGATAGDPAGSSSAAAFPADPDFLAARDERRRRRSATAVSRCAAEGVPPWEDWDDFGDPDDDSVDVAGADDFDAEAAEDEWGDSLIPWNASTTDFAGRRRGPARLTGRVSRKTRHAPEVLYEPQTVVEEAPDATGATPDAESVDVRHLRGVRASRVIAEEPEPDAEDELDLFEHIPGLEEARSVAKLSDTNIVTVYDCAVEGSSAYVIMEYVEGKTLAQIIDEVDDDITLDVVAAVFSAVSHALEVAHGEHTLHLDIKPENVIVNGKGQAKVADFGLAALMDATGSGTTGGGTIGYMPLEQMRQEPLDVRTDEWALASLTYEMLTGSNPFFADDLDAAEEAIEEAELVLPSLCWDELDAEADEVMFAALDPDMDERYEDVAAFSAALSPYLGNAKKGKRVLADIVNGKMEEPAAEEPERVWEPLPPLVDRLGLRGAAIVGRIVAAAAVALLAAAGMANLHLTPGSAMGLATDAPIAYGVVIAVCALVAVIRPSIGVLFGYGAFVVGLAGAGAWVPAVLLTAATGAWWYFVGRRGTAQAVSALMQPLFGSVGFAAASPVTCGVLLPVLQSVITAAFAFASALIMAGCGSVDIMNWDAVMHLGFSSNPAAGCLAVASQPATWVIGASWIAAAGLYSLLCVRGTRAFDIAGSVVAAAVLMLGACAAAHLASFGGSWLPAPAALLGALVPGVLGILAAVMSIPDRARWAEEEWYVEEEK